MRCKALKTGGHGRRISVISAVTSKQSYQLLAPLLFEGSCDRKLFVSWLEYLLKGLKPAHYVLILDNASIHKGDEVDAVARKYKVRLAYLPAYSPDLNPIEKAWSVLKQKVRHMVTQHNQTIEQALENAIKHM